MTDYLSRLLANMRGGPCRDDIELARDVLDEAADALDAAKRDARRIDWLGIATTAARRGKQNIVVWECRDIRIAIDAALAQDETRSGKFCKVHNYDYGEHFELGCPSCAEEP